MTIRLCQQPDCWNPAAYGAVCWECMHQTNASTRHRVPITEEEDNTDALRSTEPVHQDRVRS